MLNVNCGKAPFKENIGHFKKYYECFKEANMAWFMKGPLL
jgi:hypothetical protein